jgi:prepilin-type N-terminal cleavage/methylation domain-containing protein
MTFYRSHVMRQPVHRRNGQDGFTLIELMIAMAILGTGMVAAVSMHFGTARNNTNGNIITQANMLAKTQLETLKSLNIADMEVNDASWPFYAGPGKGIKVANTDSSAVPDYGGIFRRYWTIENLGTDARRITVTVEWDRFGGQRRVVISSNTKGNGV